MLVQQLHKLFRHEELRSLGAQKRLFHLVIVLFFAQPRGKRAGETQFRLVEHALRQMTRRRAAQRNLLVVVACAILRRNGQRQLKHFAVQKRNAQLKRMRHGHAVGLQNDVVNHPRLDVYILQLRYAIKPRHFVVIRLGVNLRRINYNLVLQILLTLVVFEHVIGA